MKTFISKATVGSAGQSIIELTNIPSNYDDLEIIISARTTRSQVMSGIAMQANNADVSGRWMYGVDTTATANSSATSATVGAGAATGTSANSGFFGSSRVIITQYASSAAKSSLCISSVPNKASTSYRFVVGGKTATTSPITSLKFIPEAGDFVEHSTVAIYGITHGSDGTTTVS